MSDNNTSPSPAEDPNTVRELQRARADLVKVREELKAIRGERDSAISERDDAIKSRDGYKGQIEKQKGEYEARISTLTEAETAAKKAAEDALASVRAESTAAVIRAEAKAAATRAGAVSPDDLVRLVDLSSVKMADDGKITGLDEAIAAEKEARSYMFTQPAKPGTATGTTASSPAPKPGQPGDVNARTMTAEEYAAARSQITGR